MKSFNVYQSPGGGTVLVRQGWSWPAFLFTFAWALWNEFWIQALIIIPFPVLAVIGTCFGSSVRMLTNLLTCAGVFAVMAFFGLKGNSWRGARLAAKGYIMKGVVSAESADEALEFVKNNERPAAEGEAAR